VLVDPLHDFYGSSPCSRDAEPARGVRHRARRGAAGGGWAFDLVIIENCIDHVENMHGVLRELVRVMAPGGLLYLTVNCARDRLLRAPRAQPPEDRRGHPYTFTPRA